MDGLYHDFYDVFFMLAPLYGTPAPLVDNPSHHFSLCFDLLPSFYSNAALADGQPFHGSGHAFPL